MEESDLGTRIIFANTSFERTMGYTQAEVYGRHPNLLRGHQHDPDGFAPPETVWNVAKPWTSS
ncbi:MAG: PAS domain S-box protein [Pleurocapsa sp. SU_196_0]|nr:PAS domain S-box protein [Pleurocapsa sp. SU_196_0]